LSRHALFLLRCVRNGALWGFGGLACRIRSSLLEAAMKDYVHKANIEHYRRLIAESANDPNRNEDRHKMLLTLLAEELAKEKKAAR
jgi:hypothetical protein